MTANLFRTLCQELGYDPASVLSVRVHPRKVVVVHADPAGTLRRAVHRQAEVSPRDIA